MDIIEKLRIMASTLTSPNLLKDVAVLSEASNEIERLREEVKKYSLATTKSVAEIDRLRQKQEDSMVEGHLAFERERLGIDL